MLEEEGEVYVEFATDELGAGMMCTLGALGGQFQDSSSTKELKAL